MGISHEDIVPPARHTTNSLDNGDRARAKDNQYPATRDSVGSGLVPGGGLRSLSLGSCTRYYPMPGRRHLWNRVFVFSKFRSVLRNRFPNPTAVRMVLGSIHLNDMGVLRSSGQPGGNCR